MAEEEEEAQAGLVEKGASYPKTTAKSASTSEYSREYRLRIWPPAIDDDTQERLIVQWQADARDAGFVPAKTAVVEVEGEGGLTFVTITGRVKKATAKES